MRKVCTNNKCGKTFVVKDNTRSCSYRGKEYTRLRIKITNDGDKCSQMNLWDPFVDKEINYIRRLLAGMPNKEVSPKKEPHKKTPKGVYLLDHGSSWLKTASKVRKWTGMGLMEVKELVYSAPVFIDSSKITYNHLNSTFDESAGVWIPPEDDPLTSFTKDLDEVGCRYRIIYS